MNNNSSIVDELLYEEESTTLDYKAKEFNFEGASEDEKGELLEDILAFTNAWRRADAYIMIGVKEIKGSKSEVVGIRKHIDNADLQQFVNSKTQCLVAFSYEAVNYEGKQIGLIRIPLQKRPIYLKENYGKLMGNTVYLRRGSSTTIANPDEIAIMGVLSDVSDKRSPTLPDEITRIGVPSDTSDKRLPALNIQFVNTEENTLLGDSLDISTISLDVPTDLEIPDYVTRYGLFAKKLGMGNTNFYRKLAEYMKIIASVGSLNFAVTNSGKMVAQNVRVEAVIKDISENILIMSENELPAQPVKSRFNLTSNIRGINVLSDLSVKKDPKTWFVTIFLDKIQPNRTVCTKSMLFVGTTISSTLELKCSISADNLSDPIIKSIKINVNPVHHILTVRELVKQGDNI